MSARSATTEEELRCELDSAVSRYYSACAAAYSLGSARRYVDAEIATRVANLELARKDAEQAVRDARCRLQSFLAAAHPGAEKICPPITRAAGR